MTFVAQHNTTDEKREMSEAEVRQEIIDTLQHDMETCQEYSDDEIANNVNALDIRGVFQHASPRHIRRP
jgi:hypothetical protein